MGSERKKAMMSITLTILFLMLSMTALVPVEGEPIDATPKVLESAQLPEPHTELGSIPAQVARLRQTFETGRTRTLEWRREQLKQLIQRQILSLVQLSMILTLEKSN